MSEKIENLVSDFVDYLMPELTPYETSLYMFLLRNSILRDGSQHIRIGKRTIAHGYGTGSRGVKTNYAHMTKVIKGLEEKGCVAIGDTTREGTLYTVILPRDVPIVKERIASLVHHDEEEDYFTDPQKRITVFDRDDWTCQYCGERVTRDNATLDHYIPQSRGGTHAKVNLRTCCLICNGIKSGKSFEEAAPFILKSIQERRQRSRR
jgi:hypothetical protein